MNDRLLAIVLALLVVVFLLLNFTADSGTLFLILAVLAGVALGVILARGRPR